MPDISITTAGILKLLQNLDIHKASGPDQVSARVLKETAESVAPILKAILPTLWILVIHQMIGEKQI